MADELKGGHFIADERVEGFYLDIFASAKARKLSDAETIAVLSKIVGRMIAAAPAGKDSQTLRDTAEFNLRDGAVEISGVVDGLRKRH